MRVGLALPQFDMSVPGERPLRWTTLLGWARRAEQLGFDSVWLADHLFYGIEKYGAAPGGHFGYDPLVALGGLARATRRVRLGLLVACSQLRPPSVLAKSLATLDVVSGGRLEVGLGAGWYEPEYRAAGIPFDSTRVRLDQLAETVEIVKGMFAGGPFSFDGDHYRVDGARCLPRPLQVPRPPVLVGGKGDRLLDVVARHADGWNTAWTWTLEDYRERVVALERACERAGREPGTVERSLGLFALVGEDEGDLVRRYDRLRELSPPGVLDTTSLDEWRRGRLVGAPADVGEQLEGWARLGVSTLIVGVGAVPFSVGTKDDLELVAAACKLSP